MLKDFHRQADGLGPTLTLMKKKDDGLCIAGFTTQSWSSWDRDDDIEDDSFRIDAKNKDTVYEQFLIDGDEDKAEKPGD